MGGRSFTSSLSVDVLAGTEENRRGPTKTAKSVLTVSLCHPVLEDRGVWKPAEAGRETLRVLDRLRVLRAIAPDRELPLFPARTTPSQPRDGNAFYARWAQPHALRHSFGSILLSCGANLLYMVCAGRMDQRGHPAQGLLEMG